MKLFKIFETSFENYDATVRNYLTKVLGAAGYSYSNSQIFSIVFDGIKSVMQNVMFYIEDAMTEQNIETAYRKSSIYSLAKLSGYEAYYGSAASGLVNCYVNVNSGIDSASNKVYIKNGTSIINTNTGYSYIVYLPSDFYVLDLSKPLQANNFKIVQGSYKTAAYIANGEPLELLKINTNGLFDKEYIEVRVDGELYIPAACLYDMTEDSKEYIINVGYNNELDILFGNGIHGKKLNNGQNVTVKYVIHAGEAGNIKLDDIADLQFNDALYDAFGNTVNSSKYFTIKLLTSISGGAESDTIENVRQMIGYNSRSLVLANEDNFKLFLKRFSFIGQTNIWCENNSLVVNAVCLNNFKNNINTYDDYFAASSNNKLLLTDYQKEMVTTTLDNSNKTYAGITLNFVDPIVYKYSIISYIKISSVANKDLVKSEVSKYVAEYFMGLPANTSFVAKSDLIKFILDNVPYIESIDISFISDIQENAKYHGYYYDYDRVKVDNVWQYVYTKHVYSLSSKLGLDDYGNISIANKFGVPIISNNVSYCSENENGTKNKLVLADAIQFLFI